MERELCCMIATILERESEWIIDELNDAPPEPDEEEDLEPEPDEEEDFEPDFVGPIRTRTFEEVGMLTLNEGFTLSIGDREYQFQCVRSR